MSVFPVQETGDGEWISVADLMSGLMLVFLMIAVLFMLQIRSTAVLYDDLRSGLFEALQSEFSGDLDHWNAEIDPTTLAFRFREPEIFFEAGKTTLREPFKVILKDFFPRYTGVLTGESYRNHIEEVRIEGHTSSEWEGEDGDSFEAYWQNMALSQGRTLEVLRFVAVLPGVVEKWDSWLRERVTANGLSSSKLILLSDREEDRRASRRVEFRVRTDAEEQMILIRKIVR
jgi:outer membrane protein OmpA-like peptidoglycan-associated protein